MNVGSDFRKHDNDGLLNLLIELRVALLDSSFAFTVISKN